MSSARAPTRSSPPGFPPPAAAAPLVAFTLKPEGGVGCLGGARPSGLAPTPHLCPTLQNVSRLLTRPPLPRDPGHVPALGTLSRPGLVGEAGHVCTGHEPLGHLSHLLRTQIWTQDTSVHSRLSTSTLAVRGRPSLYGRLQDSCKVFPGSRWSL